jgi:hypothetical protein
MLIAIDLGYASIALGVLEGPRIIPERILGRA